MDYYAVPWNWRTSSSKPQLTPADASVMIRWWVFVEPETSTYLFSETSVLAGQFFSNGGYTPA